MCAINEPLQIHPLVYENQILSFSVVRREKEVTIRWAEGREQPRNMSVILSLEEWQSQSQDPRIPLEVWNKAKALDRK